MDGNPAWEPLGGRFEGALKFDGGDRINVPAFDISGSEITIALWVKITSLAGVANESRFVSKATGVSGNDHYWMLGNFLDGTALRFRLKTSMGNTMDLVSAQGVLQTDAWQHVAATYDGSMMRVFVNGAEKASQAHSGEITAGPAVAVGLGNQPAGAGDRGVVGSLDDIRIYDKALDFAEMGALSSHIFLRRMGTFGNLRSEPQGRYDDANSNGYSNILERAFGLDPDNNNAVGLPLIKAAGTFSLVYQHDRSALDLTLTPQITQDFTSPWLSGSPWITLKQYPRKERLIPSAQLPERMWKPQTASS